MYNCNNTGNFCNTTKFCRRCVNLQIRIILTAGRGFVWFGIAYVRGRHITKRLNHIIFYFIKVLSSPKDCLQFTDYCSVLAFVILIGLFFIFFSANFLPISCSVQCRKPRWLLLSFWTQVKYFALHAYRNSSTVKNRRKNRHNSYAEIRSTKH